MLAAAAPTVPVVVKPALPQGVSPAELPPGALKQLFRAGDSGGGNGEHLSGSNDSTGDGSGLWQATQHDEQEWRMPARQLCQLWAQLEDPRPLAAAPHPMLGNLPVFVGPLL